MNDLRNLLIDCRIELRKFLRDFQKTELCARLDTAIQALPKTAEEDAARPAPVANAPEKTPAPNRVALAWQAAARDLKFSDPALYETLYKKVMARLETRTMVDQVTELRQLEQALTQAQTQLQSGEQSRKTLETERDALLGALASAVPELRDGGDRVAVALARIDWLKAQRAKTAAREPVKTAAEPEAPVPNAEVLAAVAAGARKFTDLQREWSIGEAMVLSGFRLTPMELIEQGDAQIARIITQAKR